MPKFIYMKDAIGKTVKDVIEESWENEAFIVFTDGTFTRFSICRADHGDESDSLSNGDREQDRYRDSVGVKLGFWTEDTLAAEKARVDADRRETYREGLRHQYEELKRIFEGQS